ncbi:membrane protein [Xenorhabdus mauleonii]|uniref:Membrane protein n=1 Tax=Xenorhabdus mauleonii TaxID=351675 RepID=A0A1I3L4I2_9GAMM|nr:DUF805 domain-containing protein [Xenorhabdus mauleonii]PHM44543.1 membrane protein [Xenorhabdus mauleonii]SFI79506.1 Uncharacterized membrane protein YhaH, DUF805 family [Xenorhabdus mauleonii]
MNWYLNVLKNYATFSGRARRQEYWMFYLFQIIVIFALTLIGSIIDESLGAVFYVIYAVATLIPSLAVTVRRLHDTNRSGWWFLLVFVPVAGLAVFVFTLLEGTQGDNDYGADPKRKL